jgi:hypothetical protein
VNVFMAISCELGLSAGGGEAGRNGFAAPWPGAVPGLVCF